jgi:peptidoglycan/LPS O-acetylase OafA/YrhL
MKRLQELDVLRGMAALAVVLFHYTSLYDSRIGHTSDLLFVIPFGNYGVHLFFMISGFVIFMTLNRTRDPLDFIVSRFSRLFPAYWTAIAITFSVLTVFGLGNHTISISELLINLTMMQNFLGVRNVDGSYWTLLYELFFYCIMFALYLKGWLHKIERFCLLWLAAESVRLLFFLQGWDFPWKLQQLLILEYCHLFIAGIMFYQLGNTPPRKVHFLILSLCLLMQWFLSDWMVFSLIASFFAIFYLFVTERLSFIVNKPLVFLGTISYSLYLIHQVVGFIIIRELEARGIDAHLAVFITLGFIILLASAMNILIEKPAMKIIRKRYICWKKLRLENYAS